MKEFGWKKWFVLLTSGSFYLFFIHANLFAYIHWKTFTKQKVVQKAEQYIERHNIQQNACLYVVKCIDDEAHLSLVKNIDTWDIEETQQIVWQRKFDGICTGRTVNIGIYFESENRDKWTTRVQHKSGIWSFSTNKFFAQMSRFDGGSFSRYPWETCTPEFAFISNQER